MAIYTTLNEIREHSPCADGWYKLLKSLGKTHADDEPLALEQILDSNGLADALWALRAVKGYDKEIRLFACQCARLVLPIFEGRYPDDARPRKAIKAAEAFALGQIGTAELEKAYVYADAAAYDAYAADAAYFAARAAYFAAYAAARAADAADAIDAAARAARAAYFAAAANAAATNAARAVARAEFEKLFLGMRRGEGIQS